MRHWLAAAAAGIGAAVLLSGCGTGGLVAAGQGDASRGQQLFTQKCASCHTLAAASSTGTIGPNLDDAFSADREQGFDESTIRQVVVDQIRVAACVPGHPPFKKRDPLTDLYVTQGNCMPRDIVTGQDAADVATYVARVAGNPQFANAGAGGKITATNGKQIFLTAGCTGCHTLKDAGSTGTIGPNLDALKPPKSLVIDRVTNGKRAMPSFKDKLSPAQIQAVADYVSSVAGK